jgi:hypothetical protein
MPPKSCPKRLERLIATDPAVLRPILRALQDRRQKKGPETFAVESPSRVTINLDNYSVTVRSELALALAEIDSPDIVELIRECAVCQVIFWAGRIDKHACDKHVGQRRKGKQRQKEKVEQTKTGEQAAELKHAHLKEEAVKRLSPTAVALLNSIVIHGNRIFWKIDNQAYEELKQIPGFRVPQRYIIRRTLTMLVDRGYLRHDERAESHEDRYEPRQKLIDLW